MTLRAQAVQLVRGRGGVRLHSLIFCRVLCVLRDWLRQCSCLAALSFLTCVVPDPVLAVRGHYRFDLLPVVNKTKNGGFRAST